MFGVDPHTGCKWRSHQFFFFAPAALPWHWRSLPSAVHWPASWRHFWEQVCRPRRSADTCLVSVPSHATHACCHVLLFFHSSPPNFSFHIGTICRDPHDIIWKSCQNIHLSNKTWVPPWGHPKTSTVGTKITIEPHRTMIAHVNQGLCEFVCKCWKQPDKMSGQLKTSYSRTRLSTHQSLATLNIGHALICDLNRSSSYTQQPSTSLFLHNCVSTSVGILHTQTFAENQIWDSRESTPTFRETAILLIVCRLL